MDCGFPKSQRLRVRSEFRKLTEMGLKVHVPHFLIVYMKSEQARIGITVTSKVGNAVERNRIKRCVREFYRTTKHLFPPCDFNLVAKRGAPALSCSQIFDELQLGLKKIRG